MAFLDRGFRRAQSEEFELEVARFEIKWSKVPRTAKMEQSAEPEDPSIPHKPPKDSTADTYIPPPHPIHATESRTPRFRYNSKMVKIITL